MSGDTEKKRPEKRKCETAEFLPPHLKRPATSSLANPNVHHHTAYVHSSSSTPSVHHNVSKSTNLPPPVKSAEDEAISLMELLTFDHPEQEESPAETPQNIAPSRRSRFKSDEPLKQFIPHLDNFLSEFIRRDGRGNRQDFESCTGCSSKETALYRCQHCLDVGMVCQDCIMKRHKINPFHSLQKWNGRFFDKTSVWNVDPTFFIQLGHPAYSTCLSPIQAVKGLYTVIDITGIHQVRLRYCGCIAQAGRSHLAQLLAHGFLPATVSQPMTLATINVLSFFQLLSFMSKISLNEFWQTLCRLTDNIGQTKVPDRERELRRAVRILRHIRCMKRSGRGHEEGGIKATKPGECAVLCPACPQPRMNINIETLRNSNSWLYTLFLAMDANFRVRRLNVSSEEADPGFNHGYAYFVESRQYMELLRLYDTRFEDERSTCNNFDAIKLANIRGGKGIATSGIAACSCARHDMRRPTSVGDLQKGERYVNMDLVLLSSLANHNREGLALLPIVMAYDVACQYHVNFFKRNVQYPADLRLKQAQDKVIHLVPKFHLPAHIEKCQSNFSFNFTPHVGRTDGEASERAWAAINALAASTKEMGPGSRRDTLDDHFGDQNFRKYKDIDKVFTTKHEKAKVESELYAEELQEHEESRKPEEIQDWTRMVQEWEQDHSKLNPYQTTFSGPTGKEIRLRMAKEDKERSLDDKEVLHPNITPFLLISKGLELEESQRRLRVDFKAVTELKTDLQASKVVERGNGLRRRISAWAGIQHLYMPIVAKIRLNAEEAGGDLPQPYDIDMFLPSQLVADGHECSQKLQEFEWDLREAQALESLASLRRHLLCKAHLFYERTRNIKGQRQGTRSWSAIDTIKRLIELDCAQYRAAHLALTRLSGPLKKHDEWQTKFRVLNETDVTGLSVDDNSRQEPKKSGSKSKKSVKTTSWIWKVAGLAGHESEEMDDALRVEWCRTRARMFRWKEELKLTREEMRRVLAFFTWKRDLWKKRAKSPPPSHVDTSAPSLEGLTAYAHRQAHVYSVLLDKCTSAWSPIFNPPPTAPTTASTKAGADAPTASTKAGADAPTASTKAAADAPMEKPPVAQSSMDEVWDDVDEMEYQDSVNQLEEDVDVDSD